MGWTIGNVTHCRAVDIGMSANGEKEPMLGRGEQVLTNARVGNGHRRQERVMACRSPRNVIVADRERAPFAEYLESLPIGPEYRSVVTPNSIRA